MVQELTLFSSCSLLFIKRFPAQCCSVNIMDCSFFGTLEVNGRIKLALCYWAKHSRQKEDWCHTNASTLFSLRLKCCNSMGQDKTITSSSWWDYSLSGYLHIILLCFTDYLLIPINTLRQSSAQREWNCTLTQPTP